MDKALQNLYDTVVSRRDDDAEASYTARLFGKGCAKIAQKVGEEAVEVVIGATLDSQKEVIAESADLFYHLMVLWADMGITPDQVARELDGRIGISGIDEKNNRIQK